MTKSQIAIMADNYQQRLDALNLSIAKLTGNEDELTTLQIMRAEYNDKLDNLSIDKEYHISFEGGGCNTTRATNDEDALKFAKAEYDGKHTKVKAVFLSETMDRI